MSSPTVSSPGSSPGSEVILGIDLGTTNSLVAVHGPDGPRVLGDAQALVPSVVAILEDGQVLVGDAAKALAFEHPERVIHSAKRLIGRTTNEVRLESSRLPYRVVAGPKNQARIRIQLDGKDGRGAHRDYAPEEISAFVLRELVTRARAQLGDAIGPKPRVVITVPAYFDEAQRQATKRAAELAGLETLRLVNEPTAASLAYGVGGTDGTVLVYDLGGGTFDVSVLKIQDGVFRVLSTHGDTQLGGDDFDREILDRLLGMLQIDTESASPQILATVRSSAEALKIRLSEASSASLAIDVGGERKEFSLSRVDFEEAIRPALERTRRSVRAALADAELQPEDIADVVLVGGSTRIPAVRAMLEETFGHAPHGGIDPDRAVALGAARQAAILSGEDKDLLLLDVVPLSLGIETLGGAFSKLIVRNTTVPCQVTEEFSTQVENQSGIDLNLYQGERELVADCRHIGSFKLTGIPPMPAGLPRIAVTFVVDQHGLLRVSAREMRSGQTASIEVLPTLGLSEDEVRNMVHESIEKAGEDVVAREALDLRNKARAVIRGTEEALAKGSDGLEPEQAYSIRKALSRTKKLVDTDDLRGLHTALDELSSYTMQLADDLIGAAVRNSLRTKAPVDIGEEHQ